MPPEILALALLNYGVLALFWATRWRSIHKAASRIEEVRRIEATNPGTVTIPSSSPRSFIERTVTSFLRNFSAAIQNRSLVQFSVEDSLSAARRSASTCSGLLRPLAGWALLVGLIVTLLNLQASVGNLARAFNNIANTSSKELSGASRTTKADRTQISGQAPNEAVGRAGSGKLLNQAAELQKQMGEVAGAAGTAFKWGLLCISLALGATFVAALIERRARTLVEDLSDWAHAVHGRLMPTQLPITQGDLARELKESTAAMNAVVERLTAATTELSSLSGVANSLTSVSETIKTAMGQLPQDLKSSMSNINSEMISGLTTSLGQSNEHTNKILQIYADQEFRIREIRAFVESMSTSADSMKASATAMAAVPQVLVTLDSAVRENSVAADRISQAATDLTAKLPVAELTTALAAIQAMQDSFLEMQQESDDSLKRLVTAAQAISGNNGILPQIRGSLSQLAIQQKAFQQTMDKATSALASDENKAAAVALAGRMLMVLDALKRKADTHEWRRAIEDMSERLTDARKKVVGTGDKALGNTV